MRGGALPPALLLTALGLGLAPASPRAWVWAVLSLDLALATLWWVALPQGWLEIVFLACWLSTAATAAMAYSPRRPSVPGAVALSLNAGIWSAAVVALSGSPLDLLKAAPCVLVAVPAGWLVRERGAIAVKVAASWLIAIAMLAAALPFLPVTPGYLPDHLQ